MEDFECKAPMYVNFVESSALNENDGADEFFDCEETQAVCDTVKCESADDVAASGPMCTSVQSECQETADAAMPVLTHSTISNTFADEQSEHRNDTEDKAGERTPENADDIINLAMKHLWTASKQKNSEALVWKNVATLPQAKGQNLHHEEDCTQKTKALLTTKNGKPRFISMAEAIRKFQTNTPDRFHSKPKTAKFISRLQHRKDIPQVSHLELHLQSHPVQYMSSSKEGKPAEGVKILPVNANPNVMELPKVDARVERKPPTESGSLILTEKVKKEQPRPHVFGGNVEAFRQPLQADKCVFKWRSEAPPGYTFTTKPAPQAILDANKDVPKKKELTATEPVVPSSSKKSRVYAISLGVKDGVKCVTEKEVHHFGIPTARIIEQKRRTKVQPFSFEERDRQRLKKKEETIQKYLEQEKKTREFRAKPVPASIKASNTQKQQTMRKEGRELQQGAHFKALPTTGIQREALKPKNTDHPLTDKNSALIEETMTGTM